MLLMSKSRACRMPDVPIALALDRSLLRPPFDISSIQGIPRVKCRSRCGCVWRDRENKEGRGAGRRTGEGLGLPRSESSSLPFVSLSLSYFSLLYCKNETDLLPFDAVLCTYTQSVLLSYICARGSTAPLTSRARQKRLNPLFLFLSESRYTHAHTHTRARTHTHTHTHTHTRTHKHTPTSLSGRSVLLLPFDILSGRLFSSLSSSRPSSTQLDSHTHNHTHNHTHFDFSSPCLSFDS